MEVLRCIIDIFSALLTPLIAIIAIYIAYQQFRLNRSRLNNELYVRRLTVYKAVSKFISEVIQKGSTDFNKLSQFYADTGEADFLFDLDVRQYIDTLYEKGIKLRELADKIDPKNRARLSNGEDIGQLIKERGDLFIWFCNEITHAKELFKKYLSITK